MRVAVCDPHAFLPPRSLVAGPFHNLDDIAAIERFVRTVVLHDEIVMEITPTWYDPENDGEWTEEENRAGGRVVITGCGPVLDSISSQTPGGPRGPFLKSTYRQTSLMRRHVTQTPARAMSISTPPSST